MTVYILSISMILQTDIWTLIASVYLVDTALKQLTQETVTIRVERGRLFLKVEKLERFFMATLYILSISMILQTDICTCMDALAEEGTRSKQRIKENATT